MEIEIKLAPVLPHQAAAVLADPELVPHLGPARRIPMHSRYFDTPALALRAAGFALRLRQEGEHTFCALKGRADAEGVRLELEVPAATADEGVAALLGLEALPAAAGSLLKTAALEPIAEVRFVRDVAVYSHNGLTFELCHDQGETSRGIRTGAIAELELELKAGEKSALDAVAAGIMARHGLQLGGPGKLAQALALGESDPGREINPFFVSSELLNFCIRQGWITLDMGEDRQLHYRLSETGSGELAARFGVNFGKPCAFIEE